MAQKKQTPEEFAAEMEELARIEKLRVMGVIGACMQVITQGQKPANEADVEDYITTTQFVQSVEAHVGEKIPIAYMFEWLTDNGYQFARVGTSTDLKWMLKKA